MPCVQVDAEARKEGAGSSRAGVIGSCETPVGKNSTLNHSFNLCLYFNHIHLSQGKTWNFILVASCQH